MQDWQNQLQLPGYQAAYYWIGDRGKRVIKRLVERYADRGQVAFITSERVDAKLVYPDAVKMLKVSGTPAVEAEE